VLPDTAPLTTLVHADAAAMDRVENPGPQQAPIKDAQLDSFYAPPAKDAQPDPFYNGNSDKAIFADFALRNRAHSASPLPTQNSFSVFRQAARSHAAPTPPRAAYALVLQQLRSRNICADRLPPKIAYSLVLRQLRSRGARARRTGRRAQQLR
jgi:hypothetical protein